VIQQANRRYTQLWGKTKVRSHHSFESMCAPRFYIGAREK
jgi:hypothetical protein